MIELINNKQTSGHYARYEDWCERGIYKTFMRKSQELIAAQSKRKINRYFLAVFPGLLIYFFRSWLIYSGIFVLLCIVPVILFGIIILVELSNKQKVLGLCIITIVVSIIVPRLNLEQIHLNLFRSKYQEVVQLARDHQLGHKGNCQSAYVLPDKYSFLGRSKDKCIFVEYEPSLVVVFEPVIYRVLLVYADTPEAAFEYISCGGSDGIQICELEERWYRCLQDWN